MAFTCSICSCEHPGLPHDVAFAKPEPYLRLPASERSSTYITPDVCVIKDRDFYLRGVLRLPFKGEPPSEYFAWGIWATVPGPLFTRYLELWEADATTEPPCDGSVASIIPGYPNTEGLPASIQFGTSSRRPTIKVTAPDHPLFSEQELGITRAREHALLQIALPALFQGQ